MRLLDLFCGAGGAAMGYYRAGFTDIVGVDIKPQPRYPFTFIQADAMTFPLDGFDAIHASPPCQAYSLMSMPWRRAHPDLVGPTRERLEDVAVPWVIENVVGAPMRQPIQLCGSSFGLRVRRHRLFEMSIAPLMVPPCSHHWQDSNPIFRVRNHGEKRSGVAYVFGNGAGNGHDWAGSMGIDWMVKAELSQAIPPAYTEYIGRHLIAHIKANP